jgi:16S rRNA (cytosine967-C5)-methyltransferase
VCPSSVPPRAGRARSRRKPSGRLTASERDDDAFYGDLMGDTFGGEEFRLICTRCACRLPASLLDRGRLGRRKPYPIEWAAAMDDGVEIDDACDRPVSQHAVASQSSSPAAVPHSHGAPSVPQRMPERSVRSFVSPSRREDGGRGRGPRGGGRTGGGKGRARDPTYSPPPGADSGELGSVDFARPGSKPASTRQAEAPAHENSRGRDGTEGKGEKKKWIWVPNPRSPREVALQVLLKRETKGSTAFIETLLEESIAKSSLEPSDRGLCKELVLGCVRWRDMLDALAAKRQKGSRKQQPGVRCLLRLGLYQIVLLDKIPSHAAVSETVGLARRCGQSNEAGFINAVLRAYADDEEGTRRALSDMQREAPALAWSHPEWLFKDWVKRYGAAAAQELMEWNNRAAGSYARINRLRATPTQLLELWEREGVEPEHVPLEWAQEGDVYSVALPRAVDTLASFEQGLFYMQDPSTLLAVHALEPQPGEIIVDLCAAPGGKACMIAQRMRNEGCLIASDIDDARLARVRDNSARLGVECLRTVSAHELDDALAALAGELKRGAGGERVEGIVEGEGSETRGWGVDKVLVDAPCSNTGVMRRRVDLRWRLQKEEIAALHEVQFALLERAAGLVREGGVVVYR